MTDFITHRNLLIDEEPLQVLPGLAVAVGLHEAIILQQLHYWLHPKRGSGRVVDGRRWVFNSYHQWREQFPFLTERQIGTAFRNLEQQGIVLSRQDLNTVRSDRRKWYSIEYRNQALRRIHGASQVHDNATDDHDTVMDGHDTHRYDGDTHRYDGDTKSVPSSITEITTEITAENTPSPATPAECEATPSPETVFAETFWPAYPRKVGKPSALRAFKKALQRASIDAIMAGLHRDAASARWREAIQKRDLTYIPHASTWLNDDRWDGSDTLPDITPEDFKKDFAERVKQQMAGRMNGGIIETQARQVH